jgi:hypothetical protein
LDLKSFSPQGECGFNSRPGHHLFTLDRRNCETRDVGVRVYRHGKAAVSQGKREKQIEAAV